MKLTVPHNWQDDLIGALDLSCIDEFYGKLEADILGGGRASNICPAVSKKTFQQEIQKLHNKGLKFDYLFNSTCLDNQELSGSMHKKLTKLCDWLQDLSVDTVTVSMPYISGFLKRNYPKFEINVSTMAQVEHPEKAKFWEGLGAAKITLYEVNVNRNFGLIKKIRKAVKCKLQLIVNNGCMYDCPFTVNHGLLCSHASQEGNILGGFIIDFYRILCCYARLKDPVNFIRSDWIRPEDLHYYEDLGVDYFKIVNRGMSTNAIKRIVAAYSKREYEGNLLDLLPSPSKNLNFEKIDILFLYKYFFHPRLINIFKLPRIKKVFREIDSFIYIDNKKLNGFLKLLQDKQCDSRSCKDCNWCGEIADEAINIDNRKAGVIIKEMEEVLDEFTSGRLFSYFRKS